MKSDSNNRDANEQRQNVTIRAKGGVVAAGNTQVLVDGVAIKGITKIELVGSAHDVWRCVLYIIPSAIDITDIDSEYVSYQKGLPDQNRAKEST